MIVLEHFKFCHVCDHAVKINEIEFLKKFILASGYKSSHVLSVSGISSLPGAGKKKKEQNTVLLLYLHLCAFIYVNYNVCRFVVIVQIPQNTSAGI